MRVTLVVLASFGAAIAPAAATASPTPVTAYLERNGKTVTTRGGDDVAIPRFGGGDRAWTQLVACVTDRFAPFQVTVTDRRPTRGDHITAVIGGRASLLGLNDRTTNGIGPYSGDVIPNATVHVFSRVGTGERDVDNLCAVTAHEVGHSLGLDHSNLCGDIMSYHNDECGTQQFLDAEAPCGEAEDRDCANGDATQNSYRRLAALVGLRAGAPRTGPKPPGAAPTDDALDTDSDAWSDDDTSAFDDFANDDATAAPGPTAPPTADPWGDAGDAFTDDDASEDADGMDADASEDADQRGDADAADAGTDADAADAGTDADAADAGADADAADAETADADDADAADATGSDDERNGGSPTAPAPADPDDEAEAEPEQRAPRWNPRRGGWRDGWRGGRGEGRRNRWQRIDAQRPHCGR
jgi:hypothetical protein